MPKQPGRILRPVFRYAVGCFPLGLHVLNVNRSREPVVVVKFNGGGQLHQKERKPPHFNLDLLIPDLEKSGVAEVHAGAMGVIDPCPAHRCDKFLLRHLSHAAQKSIGQWERKDFLLRSLKRSRVSLMASFSVWG